MFEENIEKTYDPKLAKAERFFEKARKATSFDYAIDMYLEGLRCNPEALEQGHIELHELALERQVKGGKKPSMAERIRLHGGKTPLEQMINAEYLFAKDPDNLQYTEAVLKGAVAGNYRKTAQWIADLLFHANSAADKPSLQTYLLLKDSYEAINQLDRAVVACQFALRLKPKNKEIADEYQRLSAELTVSTGKYDNGGDFTQSIKDREAQEELQSQESIVKTKTFTLSAIEHAKKSFEKDPNKPENILNLAQALSYLQEEKAENEAIELLENAYQKQNDFRFKQHAGQIKITRLRRKIREAKKALQINPSDEQVKATLAELTDQLNSFEAEFYKLCVEHYPTDLHLKYNYADCLFRNERYDVAIPLFQEAQKEPRHKMSALNKTGLCFFRKGWFKDAIDIFNYATNQYEIKDDAIAKELRYNLARSYEQLGDTEKALEIYRKIAQFDYMYEDVRQRIDDLRKSQDTS
jgi:tetratricopeptide (TPR) repeat protein